MRSRNPRRKRLAVFGKRVFWKREKSRTIFLYPEEEIARIVAGGASRNEYFNSFIKKERQNAIPLLLELLESNKQIGYGVGKSDVVWKLAILGRKTSPGSRARIIRAIARVARFDHYDYDRAIAAMHLGDLSKSNASVSVLKPAVFDASKYVREHAAESLAKLIGLRAVVDLINKRYPGSNLAKVPQEFFWSIKEKGRVKELIKKYGSPSSWFRGLPVFIVPSIELASEYSPGPHRAMHKDGAILFPQDGEYVAGKLKKFRRAAEEHEFGEIFNHGVGNAMAMLWLEKNGLFREYLEKEPEKKEEFRQIVLQDPQGFAEFKKYFPEARWPAVFRKRKAFVKIVERVRKK